MATFTQIVTCFLAKRGKLTTDGHKASRGLSATAELLVKIVFVGHSSAADCPISEKFCVGCSSCRRISAMGQTPRSTERTSCTCSLGFDQRRLSYRFRYICLIAFLLLHFSSEDVNENSVLCGHVPLSTSSFTYSRYQREFFFINNTMKNTYFMTHFCRLSLDTVSGVK